MSTEVSCPFMRITEDLQSIKTMPKPKFRVNDQECAVQAFPKTDLSTVQRYGNCPVLWPWYARFISFPFMQIGRRTRPGITAILKQDIRHAVEKTAHICPQGLLLFGTKHFQTSVHVHFLNLWHMGLWDTKRLGWAAVGSWDGNSFTGVSYFVSSHARAVASMYHVFHWGRCWDSFWGSAAKAVCWLLRQSSWSPTKRFPTASFGASLTGSKHNNLYLLQSTFETTRQINQV